MRDQKIWHEFNALPPEMQRQVADFIHYLRKRSASRKSIKHIPLENEPFVGMWRDREDMADSTAWVRNLRQTEWEKRRARNHSR